MGGYADAGGRGNSTATRLGSVQRTGHIPIMPRSLIALFAGLFGFLTYVAVVVAMADHVLDRHWLTQFVYFMVAGVAWVWPARALMFWAARARG
jgi:cation transporter-like permease